MFGTETYTDAYDVAFDGNFNPDFVLRTVPGTVTTEDDVAFASADRWVYTGDTLRTEAPSSETRCPDDEDGGGGCSGQRTRTPSRRLDATGTSRKIRRDDVVHMPPVHLH